MTDYPDLDPAAVAHSTRSARSLLATRTWSPWHTGRDIARAAADTDEQVIATVADRERGGRARSSD